VSSAGGSARSAQEAYNLHHVAAWPGSVNNCLLEHETAVQDQQLDFIGAAGVVSGLRPCMLQAWVHSTTRFTVLAILQQSLKFASDL